MKLIYNSINYSFVETLHNQPKGTKTKQHQKQKKKRKKKRKQERRKKKEKEIIFKSLEICSIAYSEN